MYARDLEGVSVKMPKYPLSVCASVEGKEVSIDPLPGNFGLPTLCMCASVEGKEVSIDPLPENMDYLFCVCVH